MDVKLHSHSLVFIVNGAKTKQEALKAVKEFADVKEEEPPFMEKLTFKIDANVIDKSLFQVTMTRKFKEVT